MNYNIYLFAVVSFMAIMCGVFTYIIVNDIRSIMRSMRGEKHENIRHRGVRRSYGQAAVFMGTVCLFTGTPQQCDDLCDDLWHHGQQVRVEQLTGEETFEIL